MDFSDRSTECTQASTAQSRRRGRRSSAAAVRSSSERVIRAGVVDHDSSSRDTSGMRSRLTSSHFVGRAGELAELQRASTRQPQADRAWCCSAATRASARPGWSPSSSSGWSERRRLVSCAGRASSSPTATCPTRRCSARCVRSCAGGTRRSRAAAGDRASWRRSCPGSGGRRRADQREDPSGQLRLFEAMLELLEILAECEPLVLSLEDVHWADRSTRAFIAFAARSLRQKRVLLLLSYRTDELHRRHPLRPLLSELERLDRARRIDLRPFDRDELSEALTDILGSGRDGSLLDRLFARSEGNPLYTEELLAAGSTAAAPRRRACATRSSRGSSSCRPTPSGSRGWSRSAAARRGDARRRDRDRARRRPGGAA